MEASQLNAKVFAFFDFDDTILLGDSLLYWQAWFFKNHPAWRFFLIINWIAVFLCGIKLIKPAFLKRILLIPTASISDKQRNSLAKSFVEKKLVSRFYPEVVKLLTKHHSLGHQVVIISASGDFYLKWINEIFPSAIIIGTKVLFPGYGFLKFPSYDSKFGNMKKSAKIKAIEKHFPNILNSSKTYGYSDSISDKFLLEYVKQPVCINPNPPLKKVAIDKNWTILKPIAATSYLKTTMKKAVMLLFGVDLQSRLEERKPEMAFQNYLDNLE